MKVVVPKPWNQKFSSAIDDLRSTWRLIPTTGDRDNLLSLHNDSAIWPGRIIGAIDERDIHNGDVVLPEGRIQGRRSSE